MIERGVDIAVAEYNLLNILALSFELIGYYSANSSGFVDDISF